MEGIMRFVKRAAVVYEGILRFITPMGAVVIDRVGTKMVTAGRYTVSEYAEPIYTEIRPFFEGLGVIGFIGGKKVLLI